MKDLMKIHNRVKFHFHTICGLKVINFQMFSWWCSSHEMSPFWVFLGPFSSKYGPKLLKFEPEIVHYQTKTVYQQCFIIRCLRTNGTYPKFSVLVHFWAQFTPRKCKIFPKTKISPNTIFLGLSDDTSPKFQINRKILIKIIKNAHYLAPKWA